MDFPTIRSACGCPPFSSPGSSLWDAPHSGAMSQPNSDFNRFLGMDVSRAESGECEMVLDVDERHMSIAERVHGGVFFTMVDTAMGRAVTSTLDQGRGCATIEAKINYFRPGPGRTRPRDRALHEQVTPDGLHRGRDSRRRGPPDREGNRDVHADRDHGAERARAVLSRDRLRLSLPTARVCRAGRRSRSVRPPRCGSSLSGPRSAPSHSTPSSWLR